MACGGECHKVSPGQTRATPAGVLSLAVIERAAMCRTCRARVVLHVDGKQVPRCGDSGHHTADHTVRSLVCPRSRHGRRPRWMGVAWVGVPRPIRWRLRHRASVQAGLPGCGCIAGLKLWWLKVRRAVRAMGPRCGERRFATLARPTRMRPGMVQAGTPGTAPRPIDAAVGG